MGGVDGVFKVGEFHSERSARLFAVTTPREETAYTPETVRYRDTARHDRHYIYKRAFVIFTDIVFGGEIDDEKVSAIILNDFRTGKIGRVTLEKVNG